MTLVDRGGRAELEEGALRATGVVPLGAELDGGLVGAADDRHRPGPEVAAEVARGALPGRDERGHRGRRRDLGAEALEEAGDRLEVVDEGAEGGVDLAGVVELEGEPAVAGGDRRAALEGGAQMSFEPGNLGGVAAGEARARALLVEAEADAEVGEVDAGGDDGAAASAGLTGDPEGGGAEAADERAVEELEAALLGDAPPEEVDPLGADGEGGGPVGALVQLGFGDDEGDPDPGVAGPGDLDASLEVPAERVVALVEAGADADGDREAEAEGLAVGELGEREGPVAEAPGVVAAAEEAPRALDRDERELGLAVGVVGGVGEGERARERLAGRDLGAGEGELDEGLGAAGASGVGGEDAGVGVARRGGGADDVEGEGGAGVGPPGDAGVDVHRVLDAEGRADVARRGGGRQVEDDDPGVLAGREVAAAVDPRALAEEADVALAPAVLGVDVLDEVAAELDVDVVDRHRLGAGDDHPGLEAPPDAKGAWGEEEELGPALAQGHGGTIADRDHQAPPPLEAARRLAWGRHATTTPRHHRRVPLLREGAVGPRAGRRRVR